MSGPWINNCVGEYNVRFFHAFLLSTAILCTYCAYLAGWVLYGIMHTRGLLAMQMKDPSGRIVPIPMTYIFQVTRNIKKVFF
jgi:hypothetical protein